MEKTYTTYDKWGVSKEISIHEKMEILHNRVKEGEEDLAMSKNFDKEFGNDYSNITLTKQDIEILAEYDEWREECDMIDLKIRRHYDSQMEINILGCSDHPSYTHNIMSDYDLARSKGDLKDAENTKIGFYRNNVDKLGGERMRRKKEIVYYEEKAKLNIESLRFDMLLTFHHNKSAFNSIDIKL